jgi:serine-type D-Ala-D-Ala carboxypeptidase (penicillin-binding protein 5/6)
MPARTREKPRFKLDVPPPAQGWVAASKRDPRATRKLTVVSLETATSGGKTPSWGAQGGSLLKWLRARRPVITLAQRRRRRRWAWASALALLLVVAVVGVELYHYATRDPVLPGPPLTAAEAAEIRGGPPADLTLRFHTASPLASMPLYVSNGGGGPAIQAQAAFVFDPVKGMILYEKNPDQARSVASLTKIMTLLLATDSGSMDQLVTVGPDAAALVNYNNSYMDLSVGEQVTMRQLLYGLMLPGGNDAAQAIADAVAGDAPTFVLEMNRNAQELGLTHTSFVSADGVDGRNTSSARDMAELTAIVIQQDGVAQITATRQLVIPQTSTHKLYKLNNTNDLLPGATYSVTGINGVKTGYTSAAGYCIAFSAVVNGKLLVGVLLGDPSDQARASDASALLNWSYAQQY